MRLTFNIEGSPEIHLDVLKTICEAYGDNNDLLDLMCCEASQTRHLLFKKRTFVDIQARPLPLRTADIFVQADVIDFFRMIDGGREYDVITCLDGIEHLKKEYVILLEALARAHAHKAVIYFTPLGEYCIEDDDNPDHHHSGWYPDWFETMGYTTIVFPNFHKGLGVGAFFCFKNFQGVNIREKIINRLRDLFSQNTNQYAKSL